MLDCQSHKEYETMEEAQLFKCTHYFHDQCISRWFLKKVECPMCRAQFQERVSKVSVPGMENLEQHARYHRQIQQRRSEREQRERARRARERARDRGAAEENRRSRSERERLDRFQRRREQGLRSQWDNHRRTEAGRRNPLYGSRALRNEEISRRIVQEIEQIVNENHARQNRYRR